MRSKEIIFTLIAVFSIFMLLPACGGDESEGGECTPSFTECADELSYKVCDDNGEWGDPVSCGDNEVCLAGTCQPDGNGSDGDFQGECTPGEAICVGDLIKECQNDGTWGAEEACSDGKTCSNGMCVSGESCQADVQTRCVDDTQMQTCNSAGDGWELAEECADSETCVNGRCEEVDCEPNVETSCDAEGNVVTCNVAGDGWWNPKPCEIGYYCADGRCIEEGQQVCGAGTESRCADTERMQVCNAEGTGWQDPVPCPSDWVCEGGTCVEGDCAPGVDFKCATPTTIQWCNSSGNGYNSAIDCPAGKVCSLSSGCGASSYVCIPDSYECADEHHIRQCNSDGSGYLPGLVPCEEGDAGYHCYDGQCIDLCEDAKLRDSYIGCDYWPVVTPNPQLDDAFKQGNQSEFAVVVANTNSDYTAQVTISTPGYPDVNKTVAPQDNTTIRLPFREISDTNIANYAFHLHSTIPVTVSQFNPLTAKIGETYAHTNDASLLLPSHVLENEYMVMAYRPMAQGQDMGGGTWQFNGTNTKSFITIVGSSPGQTEVTVKATGDIAGGGIISAIPAGGEQTYFLNQFDVLQLSSDPYKGDPDTCFYDSASGRTFCLGPDLTGTTVTSSKPVAVYAGNECQFVPHTCWACDHLEQQMFPTDSWTSQYIAAKVKTPVTSHPNIYKIVALKDDTILNTEPEDTLFLIPGWSGTPDQIGCNRTMNAGESCLIETDEDFIIFSKPGKEILVGQFMVGQNYGDQSTVDVGDPAFFLVPPVEQFRYEYVFLTPSTYADDYINILAKSKNIDIWIDGTKISNNFDQIGNINAFVMRKEIEDGTHTLTSSGRVGLIVYGYDTYVSYAYPAGLDLSFVPH